MKTFANTSSKAIAMPLPNHLTNQLHKTKKVTKIIIIDIIGP